MIDRQHLTVRAAQMVQQANGRMTEDQLADKLAVEFDYMALDALKEACRKVVRALPEPDLPEPGGQMALPYRNTGWCRVPTDEGMQIVAGEAMTAEETLAMLKAKEQRHRTQLKRIAAARPQVETVLAWEGYDPATPFNENADQYNRQIEA